MENQSAGVVFSTSISYIEKKMKRKKRKINMLELLFKQLHIGLQKYDTSLVVCTLPHSHETYPLDYTTFDVLNLS